MRGLPLWKMRLFRGRDIPLQSRTLSSDFIDSDTEALPALYQSFCVLMCIRITWELRARTLLGSRARELGLVRACALGFFKSSLEILMCRAGNHLFKYWEAELQWRLECFHFVLQLWFSPAAQKRWHRLSIGQDPWAPSAPVASTVPRAHNRLYLTFRLEGEGRGGQGIISYSWPSRVLWGAWSWSCGLGTGKEGVVLDSLSRAHETSQGVSVEGFIAISNRFFLIPQKGQGSSCAPDRLLEI